MSPAAARAGDSTKSPATPPRPLLRGTMHLAVALMTPAAFVVLLLVADSPKRYVGAAIFATALFLLYASSASYHLVPWRPSWRRVMKRVDHSMIFVLIAGTYTPFCLVVLDLQWGIPMLAVIWTIAAAGVLLKVVWPDAPRWLGVGLYLGLGWIGIIPAVQVLSVLTAPELALLAVGGSMYTAGAIVYALRRPDPWPRVFGYHEVFHAFVVAGSIIHFALLAFLILPS